MKPEDRTEAHEIAELECRRYFEKYLSVVFPEQLKAQRHHTHLVIEAHDRNPAAHGGVERRFNRITWMVLGAAAVGGGSISALVLKLLSVFA